MTDVVSDGVLDPLAIVRFVKESGNKTTNHELVRNFKDCLCHEDLGGKNKVLLKEVVRKIGTIKTGEQGAKIIYLQSKFEAQSAEDICKHLLSSHSSSDPQWKAIVDEWSEYYDTKVKTVEATDTLPTPISPPPPPLPLRNTSTEKPPLPPPKTPQRKSPSEKPPLPPPKKPVIRLKAAMDEEQIGKEEDDTFDEEVTFLRKEKAFAERTALQSNSVKDLTKSFNEIASKSQLKLSDHVAPKAVRRRSVAGSSDHDFPYAPLGKEGKLWVLAASKNDQASINRLLLQSKGTLLATRDPWNGYTALHWAAKHGNVVLIKFLIEEKKMKADVRSRGGYTPLMLAAMCNRTAAYYVLLNSGFCNPNLRDFSGRRAAQYLKHQPGHSGSEDEGHQNHDEDDGRRKRMKKKVEHSSSFLRDLVKDSVRSSKHKFHGAKENVE